MHISCTQKCTDNNPPPQALHHYEGEHPVSPPLSETAWQADGKRLTANNYTAGADTRYARRRNAQRLYKRPRAKRRREWVGVGKKKRVKWIISFCVGSIEEIEATLVIRPNMAT